MKLLASLSLLLTVLITACPPGIADDNDGEGEGEGEGEGDEPAEGEGEGEGDDGGEGEGEGEGESEGEGEAEPTDAGTTDAGQAPLCADSQRHNGGDGVCVPLGTCSARYVLKPNGQCTAWRSAPPLPVAETGLRLAVDDDRIYAVCGSGVFQGNGPENAFTRVVDGALAAWEGLPPFESAREGCAAAAVDGNLIVAGGAGADSSPLASILVGAIDPSTGGVAAWVDSGVELAVARVASAAFVHNGSIFVSGGAGPGGVNPLSSIERIDRNPDGSIAASVLVGATPDALLFHSAFSTGGGVVLADHARPTAWTWSAANAGFPSEWQVGDGLEGLNNGCIVATAAHTISVGGIDFPPAVPSGFVTASSRVLVASLSAELERGSWSSVGPLDAGRKLGGCTLASGVIVLGGGRDEADNPLSSVVVADIDAVLDSVEAP